MNEPIEDIDAVILESRLNDLDFTGVLLRLVNTQSDYETFMAEELEKLRMLDPERFEILLATLEGNISAGLPNLVARLEGIQDLERGFSAIPYDLVGNPEQITDRKIHRAKIALRVASDLLEALKPAA